MCLLMLTLIIASCVEDGSCNQNTITGVNVSVSNSGSDSDTDLDGLNGDSIESWLFTAMDDTVALVSDEDVDYSPGIPLDMNDTTITLLFKIRDNDTTEYLRDTIVLNYIQTDLVLLSVNCGFAPLFKITGGYSTMNILDSVVIYDEFITTDKNLDNVAFYY